MSTSQIPHITERQIRQRVDERSFERGKGYFAQGAIYGAQKQGMTLKAMCHGSSGGPYRVSVEFNGKGIVTADCSCPVGAGCKHIGALLLTWLKSPESFQETEAVAQTLDGLSKQELIDLIEQLLRQQPELEDLLAPLMEAAPTTRTGQAPKPAVYRRQAATAFNQMTGEWGQVVRVARQLDAILENGTKFLKRGNPAAAEAVYRGVLEEVLDSYDEVADADEEGDLDGVIEQCVEGIGQCLSAAKGNANKRRELLRGLFDVYQADIAQGGRGWGDDVPELMLKDATADERKLIAEWVRQAMPKESESGDPYYRQIYGGFLLDLEQESLDDEGYLRLCRETGRQYDLVQRLLELKRTDQALKETRQASDYELLALSDLLVRYKHADLAEELVLQRAKLSKDTRLLEWLKGRYLSHHDTAAALDLARKLFGEQPSLPGYQEVRKLSQKLGQWEAIRPDLEAIVKQRPYKDLLVDIYLDEDRLDDALAVVKAQPKKNSYGFWSYDSNRDSRLQVAKAAEKKRPQEAIALYRREVAALIEARGRGNYDCAAQFLKTIRTLHEDLGETSVWEKYIQDLRQQNKSLRALHEELTRAKV